MKRKKKAWLTIEASPEEKILAAWAEAMGESWLILECYTGIRFERWSGQKLGAEFAGRIFSDSAELRWRREAGALRAWRLQETPGGQGTEYEVEERNYFGWGEWKDGRCWEPRLPRPVEYPLKANSGRSYFVVREYFRPWPGDCPAGLDEIEEELNTPRLLAYRLTGFGTQTKEEE